MSNEDKLHDALSVVTNAYHLVLDGEPSEGAVYRLASLTTLFESDTPITTTEHFQIYVYQREYSAKLIGQIKQALRDAGFAVNQGGQAMEEMYYRDELRASQLKEGSDE